MIKNKGGSIWIVLLVILTFVMTSIALFSFISTNGIIAKIYGVSSFQGVYSNQENAEYQFSQIGERAFLKTYKEFLTDKDSVNFYVADLKNIGDYVVFENLHNELNKRFSDRFSQVFEEEYNKLLKESPEFSKDHSGIVFGKAEKSFDGKDLKFNFSGNPIEIKSGDINIFYIPTVSLGFSFDMMNISSFEKIYSAKEKCGVVEKIEMKKCFEEELSNFEVSVTEIGEDEKYNLVLLEDKKNGFLFSFIPK